MIDKIIGSIFKTDSLPILGGGVSALTQAPKMIAWLPTWESFISTMVITFCGAVLGYMVKLLLDKVFRPKNVHK